MDEKEVTKKREPRALTLTVKVNLEKAKGKELPEMAAYAFDRNGRFLASAPLPEGESAEVKLKLPPEMLGKRVKVLVGAPMKEARGEVPPWMDAMREKAEPREKGPTPRHLERRGAYGEFFRMEKTAEVLELTLPQDIWKKCLVCSCKVKGRLVKEVTLPDGTTEKLGVCGACVCIYEVDAYPQFIYKLAEADLYRIRDVLYEIVKERLPKFPPEPWPPEPWPPGPGPITGTPVPIPIPEPEAGEAMFDVLPRPEARQTNPQPFPVPGPEEAFALPGETQAALLPLFTAPSAVKIRDALIINEALVKVFLCHPVFDWLYSSYDMDFLTCTSTDSDGYFETTIYYWCPGDKPDLYFKAYQCIDGVLHAVYDPGLRCHTYWNYQCGTEVELAVTDPAARVCVPEPPVEPPPDVSRWVMPFKVGNVQLDRIKQPAPGDAASWAKRGLTDYGTLVDAPFGLSLGFRHGYSHNVPVKDLKHPNQLYYLYRWLYKKDDGVDEWHEFSEAIGRHYVDENLDAPLDPPKFPVYTLGPKSASVAGESVQLYEFKPEAPPDSTFPNGQTYWPDDDWFGDIYTGILRSHALPGGVDAAAGKYKLKLEIYAKTGATVNRLVPGPATFQFIVPTGVESDGTVTARKANHDGGNPDYDPAIRIEIEDDGFVFYLHVDNRVCSAVIDAPTIDGVAADAECGFLRYQTPNDPVRIAFHATHPDNFATFVFTITRSATEINKAAGEVAGNPVGDYAGDGAGNFTHDFPASALLGVCAEAAFAEVLRVYAKATNGWRRLYEYDAFDVRAFALAKKKGAKGEGAAETE
jgi:hypothetical protein